MSIRSCRRNLGKYVSFIIARHVPMPRRSHRRSHTPKDIKERPMQRRKDQFLPGLRTNQPTYTMQSQGNPNEDPQYQCTRCADRPTKRLRLTVPTGNISDPYLVDRDPQRDVWPQYEAHQSVGPTYGPVYQDAATTPWFQLAGHLGSYGCFHGISTQLYQLQADTHPHTFPGGYDGFMLGIGGNSPFAVNCDNISSHGIPLPGYEDSGGFPRCDTNRASPIHLTTNISARFRPR